MDDAQYLVQIKYIVGLLLPRAFARECKVFARERKFLSYMSVPFHQAIINAFRRQSELMQRSNSDIFMDFTILFDNS